MVVAENKKLNQNLVKDRVSLIQSLNFICFRKRSNISGVGFRHLRMKIYTCINKCRIRLLNWRKIATKTND